MKNSAITDMFRKSKGCMETMRLPNEYFKKSEKAYGIFNELKEKLSPEF